MTNVCEISLWIIRKGKTPNNKKIEGPTLITLASIRACHRLLRVTCSITDALHEGNQLLLFPHLSLTIQARWKELAI